jgi:hypothetical protein
VRETEGPGKWGQHDRRRDLFAVTDLVGTTVPVVPVREAVALQLPDTTGQHPTPPSTGLRELVKMTGADFAAIPRRTSTWVILGVGAAGALLAHPADDDANARIGWPTLLVASYVGVSRLHDNHHFVSDIVFGSAVGMASGWTVVGRHGRNQYALTPMPVRGGVALMLRRALVSEAAR